MAIYIVKNRYANIW